MNGRARPRLSSMSPDHAIRLVDEVIYERVRTVVDFCSLLELENMLRHELIDCGMAPADVHATATELVVRALERIAVDHQKRCSQSVPALPKASQGVVQ